MTAGSPLAAYAALAAVVAAVCGGIFPIVGAVAVRLAVGAVWLLLVPATVLAARWLAGAPNRRRPTRPAGAWWRQPSTWPWWRRLSGRWTAVTAGILAAAATTGHPAGIAAAGVAAVALTAVTLRPSLPRPSPA